MLLYAALLLAQTAPQCTAPAVLPPALAGWNAPGDSFEPGKAVTLETGPAKEIPRLHDGARPGSAVMIGFRITKMGTYASR